MYPAVSAAVTGVFESVPLAGLVSAYVFGSHAAESVHRESDIDVGVLVGPGIHRTRESRFEARLTLLAELQRALGATPVDLVLLNDVPPHLVRRIMTEGIRIFCADAAQDHAARRTAMLRAADLEPFLRRTRAIKLRAIAR